MNKAFLHILSHRFDVSMRHQGDLLKAHKAFFGTLDYWNLIAHYFKRRLREITSLLSSGEPVFLTYIFHIVMGHCLTQGWPDQQQTKVLLQYVKSVRDGLGGYLPIHKSYIKQFPKLGASENTPMVPEIYASYYGFWTEQILGYAHNTSKIDGLLTWGVACQQASGLIYNPTYSNTMENRRFESEKTAQLYYAVELLVDLAASLSEPDLEISLNDARDWVLTNFSSFKSVAGRYFALKALLRIAPDEICNVGIEELRGFLKDRLSADNDGYYDYRLVDKIDESMSSRCYITDDVNTSHVFSTYYSLALQRIVDLACGGTSDVSADAIRVLVERARNADGGFGRHIQVKAFPTPFGPDTTDLETLLVALVPMLFA